MVSTLEGFHCTCTYATVLFTLYLYASVFSISVPSTHLPNTRSTEYCNFWSLLTHHQETLQELMRRRRVPVLLLQTTMSLHQWVRTSVSLPSGLSDYVSHDLHKDQVAGSRETTALVRPFNIGLHVCLVNKECTLHTTFGMLFISSHWSCSFLLRVFLSIGYLVKYLHNVRKVWHCSHTLNKVLVCRFRIYCN